MSSKLDLSRLALSREPSQDSSRSKTSATNRRPHWLTRYILPAVIVLGLAGLLSLSVGSQLLPAVSVTTVPVVVKRAQVQTAGTELFQAPGWVEPRPTPINVPALAPGVIEDLFVVEGEQVSKDQPLAQLIDVDAKLTLRQSEAALAIREGELARAVAEHQAATQRFEQPVHLEAELADAESLLAAAQVDLQSLPRLIERAESEVAFAQQSLAGKKSAGAGVADIVVQRAAADLASAEANLKELSERQPNLRERVKALQHKSDALRQKLQLLIDERRQMQEADAKVKTAQAMKQQAEVEVERARINLDRMIVRAPLDGRILRLVAAPGDRVMGQTASGDPRSSTVVQMYQPGRLQIRADVRLEDVPLVTTGQPVEIETASSATTIQGRVLLPTSTANIQKNTLEVKVELIDPPPSVTPEMLVTATFLAPASDEPQQTQTPAKRMFLPEELVRSSEQGTTIWVVSPEQRAENRSITIGARANGGLVEVTSGIVATDKLITSGFDRLQPGTRVTIQGDDPRIGLDSND